MPICTQLFDGRFWVKFVSLIFAQVFASADVYFSMDGKKFSEFPVRWTPKREMKNETTLLVDIPLKGRLAKYIRLEFYHSNYWLLFSEISFLSGDETETQ